MSSFSGSPDSHFAVLLHLDVNDVRTAAHGAVLDVFLLGTSRQVDGYDDLFATRLADVVCLVLHRSPANSLHFESEPFELGHDSLALVALDLDATILDRTSSAAALLELGGKLLQRILVQWHIEDRGYALTTSSCRLSADLSGHRFLESLWRTCHFDSFRLWSFAPASQQAGHEVHDLTLDQGHRFRCVGNVPELDALGIRWESFLEEGRVLVL